MIAMTETNSFLGWLSEQHRFEEVQERAMRESQDLLGNWVDPRDRYLDDDGSQWNTVGTVGKTGPNRYSDFSGFVDEHELTVARETCRRMFAYSEHVTNGHKLRQNYAVDTGHIYTATVRKGKKADEAKIQQLQDFLDDFRRVNKWMLRQRNTVLRYDRDGEAFRRRFRQRDGTTLIRFIQPWQVYQPKERTDDPNYEFGIQTDPEDAETVVAYWVDGKPVPAEEVYHLKANVDMEVRRGVPLVWAGRKNIVRSHRTLHNISAKAEMAAAMCVGRKHTGGNSSGASTFASSVATGQRTDPLTGRQVNVRKWGPQTTLDYSSSVEYEALNIAEGIEEIVSGNKELLRALAAIFEVTEFMLTADASNANYSSTMVAEGPVVRAMGALQAIIRDDDMEIIREAVEWAVDREKLPPDILEVCEIQCRLPNLATKDPGEEANAKKIQMEAGILSPQTWSGEEGLDYEQEQANIEAHRAAGRKMAGDVPPQVGPDGEPIDGPAIGGAQRAKLEQLAHLPEIAQLLTEAK